MDILGEIGLTFALAVCVGIVVTLALSKSKWQGGTSRRTDSVFYILVVAFIFIYSALALLRYYSFATDTTDLAQYGQMTYNGLNGRLFENSLIPDAPLFIGKSFIPIMLAFVPLYAIWTDSAILLIAQVIGLALGALPVYWFARARLGRAFGFGIALAYLASPVVTQMISYEFHEIAFATPLLAYAVFFLLRERYRPFLVMLAITLLVKEEIAFVTAGLGAFIFLFQRRYRLGLALAFGGVLWGAFLLSYVIPFFHGSELGKFYYFSGGQIAGGAARYSYLGSSLSEILTTIFTRPDVILAHVLTREKIQYVFQLLAPLGFLSLLGAEVAFLALPTLGYSLLSNFTWQYRIDTAYPAPLLAFLFFAAAMGVERLLRWTSPLPIPAAARRISLLAFLMIATASNYFLYAYGLATRGFKPELYMLSQTSQIGNVLLSNIPKDAVVVAQNEFLAHLSNRQALYEIPIIPDYRQAEYLFADPTLQWYNVHGGYWNYFLSIGYFETVTRQDSYLIAKRITPTVPRIEFANELTLLGCTIPATSTIQGGMTIRPVVAWQIAKPVLNRNKFAVQVIDAIGHVWASQEGEPQDGHLPTTHWQVGRAIGDQYALNLPPTMPGGDYAVTLAVNPETSTDLIADSKANGIERTIATIHVQKNKNSFTASQLQIEQPLYVDMQDMRFLGYTNVPQKINRNDPWSIGLYWRARSKPQADYQIVVQMRDDDGKLAFEHAARPANDTYPTTQWDAGEVLLDWHDIVLPRDVAEGTYQLYVLLRDTADRRTVGEAALAKVSLER